MIRDSHTSSEPQNSNLNHSPYGGDGGGSILIFGGTTEGRLAIDVCEQAGKPFYYSTKSKLQDVEMHNGVRLTGAMTSKDIKSFCNKYNIKCIVDAAHPFAEVLHSEILKSGKPVIRLQRKYSEHKQGVVYCKDYEDAISKMSTADIHCLLALSGANTISKLSDYWQHHKTIFRVLERKESIDIVLRNMFPLSNTIFYPNDNSIPSKEDEKTLMQSLGCDAIITKESGESGGFEEKVNAALELGMKVFVVKAPQPPKGEAIQVVEGKYGLRRAIEKVVPDFFPLKTGFTTGACATAATKAALLSLLYDDNPEEVSFALPDGEIMSIAVNIEDKGTASVIKDFSDDPDVTKGCKIISKVEFREDDHPDGSPHKGGDAHRAEGVSVVFLQGEGVGKVTLPGLGIPVGEPAINPTPRKMIIDEIRALTDKGFNITISVENGAEIAKKTFNPKVGVIGGISIIGTSGIVSPLSNEAFIQSISREMEVAKAIGCIEIGLVSGLKSEKALQKDMDIRCIHYGNFIGESLKTAHKLGLQKVILAIMLGKAVKLAEGHLDTHSHKVQMNKDFLKSLANGEADKIDSITLARELWNIMPASFFEKIKSLCYQHCRTVFPTGELEIRLIKDENN